MEACISGPCTRKDGIWMDSPDKYIKKVLSSEADGIVTDNPMPPYRSGDILPADIPRQSTIPVIILSARETRTGCCSSE